MYPKFTVEHATDSAWGWISVSAQFEYTDAYNFRIQGHADVTTNEIAVKAVQRSFAVSTVTYAFASRLVPFQPIPPVENLLGVKLRYREKQRTVDLMPGPDETFTLTIGPTDIVVVADNGSLIREVHRAQLVAIAAMQTEALLPEVASAIQRLVSPVQSPASRPLLVAAS